MRKRKISVEIEMEYPKPPKKNHIHFFKRRFKNSTKTTDFSKTPRVNRVINYNLAHLSIRWERAVGLESSLAKIKLMVSDFQKPPLRESTAKHPPYNTVYIYTHTHATTRVWGINIRMFSREQWRLAGAIRVPAARFPLSQPPSRLRIS